jgi:histone-lysine N-methyltransferase SETD3
MCIDKITERRESLRAEYDNICRFIPSFAQYAHEDFVWARLVVITRIFGQVINGIKTDGLVPMADMLNHKRPRQTKWTFDDSRQAFTITSLQPMARGDQVYDSYGQKCNSRFFVNYGFSLEENEADNEVMFLFEVPQSDPHYHMKLRFLGGLPRNAIRESQIPTNYREKKTREAFAFLRFFTWSRFEIRYIS